MFYKHLFIQLFVPSSSPLSAFSFNNVLGVGFLGGCLCYLELPIRTQGLIAPLLGVLAADNLGLWSLQGPVHVW